MALLIYVIAVIVVQLYLVVVTDNGVVGLLTIISIGAVPTVAPSHTDTLLIALTSIGLLMSLLQLPLCAGTPEAGERTLSR